MCFESRVIKNASVVELVDTCALGAHGPSPCRFESCQGYLIIFKTNIK